MPDVVAWVVIIGGLLWFVAMWRWGAYVLTRARTYELELDDELARRRQAARSEVVGDATQIRSRLDAEMKRRRRG